MRLVLQLVSTTMGINRWSGRGLAVMKAYTSYYKVLHHIRVHPFDP